MTQGTRTKRTRVALSVLLPLAWVVLALAGPLDAQTNSPGGGQNTGQAPSQGGTNTQSGSNAGGDGQSGNRTTPGGAGATGGGSSGASTREDTADGGNAGAIIGVVGLLAVVGVGIVIATRHRRVMDEAEAGATR